MTNCSEDARDSADVVSAQYDWRSTDPSRAVADLLGVALDDESASFGPLSEFVVPEALNALFGQAAPSTPGPETVVSFVAAGRLVTVAERGHVSVSDRAYVDTPTDGSFPV